MRILALIALALAAPALAQPAFEPLDALDARLAALTDGRAQPLDRRLRLTVCPTPVSIATAASFANVQCGTTGWRIRVPLLAGAIGAPVIRRGDEVELSVAGSGFAVVSTGLALEDGRQDSVVRVKPSTGGPPVSALVTGPGQVRIGQ